MRHGSIPARPRAPLVALVAAVLALGMVPGTASGDMSGYEVIVGAASAGYRYEVVSQGAGAGFEQPGFDDAAFADGSAVFGTPSGDCGADDRIGTTWPPQTDLLVRRLVPVPDDGRQLHLAIGVVGTAQVFVNGTEVTDGLVTGNDVCPGRDDVHVKVPESTLNRGGDNLVAIRARSLPSSAYLDLQAILVPAPANDDAADAMDATALPFTDELPFMGASLEDGEPADVCPYDSPCTTAWYRVEVAEASRLVIDANLPSDEESWPLGIAIYTGEPFGSLAAVASRQAWEWSPLLLQAEAGTTYLVQVAGTMRLTSYGPGAIVTVAEAADPVASISPWPSSPVTTATEVRFWGEVSDPAHQPVASYAWDFGDGTTAEGDFAAHYFKTAGTFDVVLTIVMQDGRRASASVPYTVTRFDGLPPEASFTWSPPEPDHVTDVTFSATASDPSYVGIESFGWDFGDGTTGAGETVWHRFAAGTYPVTLTVETLDGRTTSVARDVTVTQRQMADPLAGFWMWPSEPFAGQEATFYDQSWDPESIGIASQSWDFGDGSFATGSYASHAYAAPGTYTVTLTVGTWDGRTGTTTVAVTVTPPPPPVVYVYTYPGDPSAYDEVQFNGIAWDPIGGPIESYQWDFGDGATSTDPYPVHRYAADGSYTVTLTVRTPDGREAATSVTLPVATHDAAIIRLTTARSASVGQTKPITADITSRRYAETVTVQLYKGTPQGFQLVAEKRVAVKQGKTVRVSFSYRFTAADASIGQVTFKVVAGLDGYRDALPADNEALTSPTKVAK